MSQWKQSGQYIGSGKIPFYGNWNFRTNFDLLNPTGIFRFLIFDGGFWMWWKLKDSTKLGEEKAGIRFGTIRLSGQQVLRSLLLSLHRKGKKVSPLWNEGINVIRFRKKFIKSHEKAGRKLWLILRPFQTLAHFSCVDNLLFENWMHNNPEEFWGKK